MPYLRNIYTSTLSILAFVLSGCSLYPDDSQEDAFIKQLLTEMSLEEKIGQLQLVHSLGKDQTASLEEGIKEGRIGAVLNEADPETIRKLQKIAVEESRLGIPLLFGRDIIHGYKTIFPVNIGLAASFDPEIVQACAEASSIEAAHAGINWNYAPMVDITRDPRWGRMAESFGEDPLLVTRMGLAMFNGFTHVQQEQKFRMAACAKHFAGYGAAEGGRDYNTASIPDIELWNTYFKPFKALVDSGISTFMTGFNELNGIPASGNEYLFREILKGKWGFEGFVVSDWASITEMEAHGYAADKKEAAARAMLAGVDMEMAGTAYSEFLPALLEEGVVMLDQIDDAVRRILKVKYDLGLFTSPYNDTITVLWEDHLELAKEVCIRSLVLLKNDNKVLPLGKDINTLAVIGPMAHDRYEQLGTWIFDGDTNKSITPLEALQESLGKERIKYVKALQNTRSTNIQEFPEAVRAAQSSDAVLIFAGEESIITGEAHSRALLDFPGVQDELIIELAKSDKPVILVVMTPRPLCIGDIISRVDAVIYAWHPGSMGGPALADVILGKASPSGRLPVTFPKTPGQIPIYYAHKNTGRPPDPDRMIAIEDIPVRSFQTSLGNTSYYLDIGSEPLFPFGYGLTYSDIEYSRLSLSTDELQPDEELRISFRLTNKGDHDVEEVAQLYVRDHAASVTRPVRELKNFMRVKLPAGQHKDLHFALKVNELGFYDSEGNYIVEAGEFSLWVGGSSEAKMNANFMLIQ